MSKSASGTGRLRSSARLVTVAIAAIAVACLAGPAGAQSPTPTLQMKDVAPGHSFPSGANAVVVEGLGSLNCLYSQSSIQTSTVSFINNVRKTVTEISPQSGCGSIGSYESLLNGIKNYVEANANNPGTYWAGFMLDEEPGFGFSASQLETLNNYTENIMVNTPGLSWYFQEDQPNGWVLSTYNTILGFSWPAPQVYTGSMNSAVNSECSTYGNCTNLVTFWAGAPAPYNSLSYTLSHVNGAPWSAASSYWGSGYWYNVFVAA